MFPDIRSLALPKLEVLRMATSAQHKYEEPVPLSDVHLWIVGNFQSLTSHLPELRHLDLDIWNILPTLKSEPAGAQGGWGNVQRSLTRGLPKLRVLNMRLALGARWRYGSCSIPCPDPSLLYYHDEDFKDAMASLPGESSIVILHEAQYKWPDTGDYALPALCT